MTRLVTQAEFARILGMSKGYVHKLKTNGQLVMERGRVDVDASRRRIAETQDPNRDDVRARWQSEREQKQAEAAAPAAPPAAATGLDLPADKIGSSYQAARAVKEQYMARQAKLEYERAIGKLIERAEVEAAVEDVIGTLRQKLENLPHRLAPELVAKDLDHIRAALKQEVYLMLSECHKDMRGQLQQIGEID
jgi:phage terminase Nu1 subunit (DNA packaging protein)